MSWLYGRQKARLITQVTFAENTGFVSRSFQHLSDSNLSRIQSISISGKSTPSLLVGYSMRVILLFLPRSVTGPKLATVFPLADG